MTRYSLDLKHSLGSLEAKLAMLAQTIQEIKQMFEGVQDRLIALERYNSFWQGGFGATLIMGALCGNILVLLITHLF